MLRQGIGASLYVILSSGTSKREIRFPERYLPRHEGIVDLIRSAGPPDIVCLQEFSVARKIVELFESKFDGE